MRQPGPSSTIWPSRSKSWMSPDGYWGIFCPWIVPQSLAMLRGKQRTPMRRSSTFANKKAAGRWLTLSSVTRPDRSSRFRPVGEDTWIGLDDYYAGETLRVVRRPDGFQVALGYMVALSSSAVALYVSLILEPRIGDRSFAVLFAAIMGLAGGILPALRASRMSPATAMRAL